MIAHWSLIPPEDLSSNYFTRMLRARLESTSSLAHSKKNGLENKLLLSSLPNLISVVFLAIYEDCRLRNLNFLLQKSPWNTSSNSSLRSLADRALSKRCFWKTLIKTAQICSNFPDILFCRAQWQDPQQLHRQTHSHSILWLCTKGKGFDLRSRGQLDHKRTQTSTKKKKKKSLSYSLLSNTLFNWIEMQFIIIIIPQKSPYFSEFHGENAKPKSCAGLLSVITHRWKNRVRFSFSKVTLV